MKFKWILHEPSWNSLPQHKKEEKFIDILTNGYKNVPTLDDRNKTGETLEQYIQRSTLTETLSERTIRIKKQKVKWFDVFRKGYSHV